MSPVRRAGQSLSGGSGHASGRLAARWMHCPALASGGPLPAPARICAPALTPLHSTPQARIKLASRQATSVAPLPLRRRFHPEGALPCWSNPVCLRYGCGLRAKAPWPTQSISTCSSKASMLERLEELEERLVAPDLSRAYLPRGNLQWGEPRWRTSYGESQRGEPRSRRSSTGRTSPGRASSGRNWLKPIHHAILTGCQYHSRIRMEREAEQGHETARFDHHCRGEPEVTVDGIEVQFVHLLLHNQEMRDVIDTVGE